MLELLINIFRINPGKAALSLIRKRLPHFRPGANRIVKQAINNPRFILSVSRFEDLFMGLGDVLRVYRTDSDAAEGFRKLGVAARVVPISEYEKKI